MIITESSNPLVLIGHVEGTITQEAWHFYSREFAALPLIIAPEDFLEMPDRARFQYGVAFTLDRDQRQQVIDIIEQEELVCPTYIHDSAVIWHNNPAEVVGAGSFIAPHSTMLQGSSIGKFCILETHVMVAHHCVIGNNTQLHAGTMIAGRTQIGKNCTFNFKSAALNKLSICDNVEVGAISTLTKDVTVPGVYVGTPARRIGERKTFNVQ